jgi:azurin
MRLKTPILAALIATGLLGLGASRQVAAKDTVGESPQVIEVRTDSSFAFQPGTLTAKRGQLIVVRVYNDIDPATSEMPHNLVVLEPNSDVDAFATAAMSASMDSGFMPQSLAPQVVASSPLIYPGNVHELRFTVPDEPGDYPILCSFPGHCILGMRGVLTVL